MFMESFSIKIVKEPVSPLDTASFFPRLVFGVLFIIGVSMTVMGRSKLGGKQVVRTHWRGAICFSFSIKTQCDHFCIHFSFILLMVPLGFIPTAIIYMVTSMFFMASKRNMEAQGLYYYRSYRGIGLLFFVPRIFFMYVARRYIRGGFIVGRSNKRFLRI